MCTFLWASVTQAEKELVIRLCTWVFADRRTDGRTDRQTNIGKIWYTHPNRGGKSDLRSRRASLSKERPMQLNRRGGGGGTGRAGRGRKNVDRRDDDLRLRCRGECDSGEVDQSQQFWMCTSGPLLE